MAKGSRAFDYMVINDDLSQAVDEIIRIIHHKKAGDLVSSQWSVVEVQYAADRRRDH